VEQAVSVNSDEQGSAAQRRRLEESAARCDHVFCARISSAARRMALRMRG
jgi:hypothetical protein